MLLLIILFLHEKCENAWKIRRLHQEPQYICTAFWVTLSNLFSNFRILLIYSLELKFCKFYFDEYNDNFIQILNKREDSWWKKRFELKLTCVERTDLNRKFYLRFVVFSMNLVCVLLTVKVMLRLCACEHQTSWFVKCIIKTTHHYIDHVAAALLQFSVQFLMCRFEFFIH